MAILKFGGGVTGIRGQVGGNIFSANTNGPYIRSWATIPNPRSLAQTVRRYYFTPLSAQWAALQPQQRTDWNDYGAAHVKQNALGEDYYCNGWQWFVSCNSYLSAWGGPAVQDAPIGTPPATVACNSLVYEHGVGGDDQYITFDAGVFGNAWCVLDAYVIPYSVNTSWPSNYYQMFAQYDVDPYTLALYFHYQHVAKWGSPQEGYQCFVRVYTGSAEGLRSLPWCASAIYPPEP